MTTAGPITVGVDFGDSSEIACRHASRLAMARDTPLVATHAINSIPASAHIGDHIRTIREDQRAAATRRLHEIAEIFGDSHLDVRLQLVDGTPETALAEAAAAEGADLLVVGTHGRSGLSRLVLGSVAEATVRHAQTDVLVARDSPDRYRRLLVPVDFEDSTQRVLERAVELADPDSAIDVLHCWQLDESEPAESVAAVAKQIQGAAAACGRALLERFRDRHRGLMFHEICGPPAHAIVEWLSDSDYDLAVLGSAGRTGLRRLLAGSVAETVVRHAPCSVLVVKDR